MSYDAMCQVINTGETHKTYEAIKRNVSWHFQHLFMNFHVHIQNMINLYCVKLFCTNTPGDVYLLELVETSQHTSTSNTSQDVGSSTLHQGHEGCWSQHPERCCWCWCVGWFRQVQGGLHLLACWCKITLHNINLSCSGCVHESS